MDDFVKALDGRIQSMAAAHSLLSQNRWNAVDLSDLVRSQLAPYATEANASANGPNVTVTAATTPAVAMVLHELVTNAAKYGALSTPEGRVSVSWDTPSEAAAGLTIEWHETDGPPVTKPASFGFGNNLIRELIPHELGGSVELAFNPGGVYCRMRIPLASLRTAL
jgi:two-component sensor histidine kinase